MHNLLANPGLHKTNRWITEAWNGSFSCPPKLRGCRIAVIQCSGDIIIFCNAQSHTLVTLVTLPRGRSYLIVFDITTILLFFYHFYFMSLLWFSCYCSLFSQLGPTVFASPPIGFFDHTVKLKSLIKPLNHPKDSQKQENYNKMTGETPEVRSDKRRRKRKRRKRREEREEREERKEIFINLHSILKKKNYVYWQKCSKSEEEKNCAAGPVAHYR